MRRNFLFASSMIAVATLSTSAFAESPAQSKDPASVSDSQLNPAVQGLNTEPQAGADGGVTNSTATTMDDFVAMLGTGSDSARTIGQMKEVSSLAIVDTSNWANADRTAYDAALSKNAKSVRELQAAIAGNKAFEAELSRNKLSADKVLATRLNADGTVTVYIR